MAMKRIHMDEFEGVIQTLGDATSPVGAAPWSYGLIHTKKRKLARLGGKLCLPDSSVSMHSVTSINQLDFDGDNIVLVNHGSQRTGYDSSDLDVYAETVNGIEEYGI